MLFRLWNLLTIHPKKSVVLAGAAVYGFKYCTDTYQDGLLRRSLCSSLLADGRVIVGPVTPLRHVTVLLNPFCRNGKMMKAFEKNVGPLLHLSGLDVQMVYITNDDEAKQHLNELRPEATKAILVAGDDNLLQTVATALLRRQDYQSTALWQLPIGVVPLGVWNSFASKLRKEGNFIKWCHSAVKPVLRERSKRQHILEVSTFRSNDQAVHGVQPDEFPSSNEPSTNSSDDQCRVVYALSGLEWSVWRDIEHGGGCGAPKSKQNPRNTNDHRGCLLTPDWKSPGTWFRNATMFFRHSWAWIRSDAPVHVSTLIQSPAFFEASGSYETTPKSQSNRSRIKRGKVMYTPVCSGCSRCWRMRQNDMTFTGPAEKPKPVSGLSRLFGVANNQRNTTPAPSKIARSDVEPPIENPECGVEQELDIDAYTGIIISLEDEHLRLDVSSASSGWLSYLQKTWIHLQRIPYHHCSGKDEVSDQVIRCNSVRIYPTQTQNEYFWIDNSHFEARPVEIRVRLNALNMFFPEPSN